MSYNSKQPNTAVDGYGRPLAATTAPNTTPDTGAYTQAQGYSMFGKQTNTNGNTDYLSKLEAQKAALGKQYVPDEQNKGRGVANWFKKVFGGSGQPKTVDQSRQQIQNIALVGDIGRHVANLIGTANGASPQQIQSQVALNDARWKAQDALAAEQAKAQKEYALKVQKLEQDAAYKTAQLGLSADRNAIAKGNFEIAKGRYEMDADMHEVNKTAKQARIAKTKHDMELGDKRFAEQVKHNRTTESQRERGLAISAQREGRLAANGTGSGTALGKGSKVYSTPKGTKYHLSKEFQENIGTVYNDLVAKGVIKSQQAYDAFGRPVQGKTKRPSKQQMIEEVMKAADSNRGHAIFVKWGKKHGYKYVDGTMSDAQKRETMPGSQIQGTNLGLG